MNYQLILSEEPKVLDLAVAATILKVHPETLRRNVIKGKIYGFQVGNRWKIPTEEVERFLTGRPSLLAEKQLDDLEMSQTYIHF